MPKKSVEKEEKSVFDWIFSGAMLYYIPTFHVLPRGVTVAQMVLIHLVQVRILAG